MDAESDSPSANEERRSDRDSNESGRGRQMLLEEARTTTNQQLAQLNKLDDEAVRTVRIALVLSGLLVGGAKFLPFPQLGLFGVLGTLSLVGSLMTSLFVYGTTSHFIGPTPDELATYYKKQSNTEETYFEVIDRYKRGLGRNRRILGVNGLVFGLSRLLLAGAIALFASAFAFHLVVLPLDVSSVYELLSVVENNI